MSDAAPAALIFINAKTAAPKFCSGRKAAILIIGSSDVPMDAKPVADGIAAIVTETGEGPFAQIVTIGGHVLHADEPAAAGGSDLGPTPYDLLKAALGACTAMSIRLFARRHEWVIGTISVAVRHDKVAGPGGQGRIDRFAREITISGPVSDEQRVRLLQVAEACPVSQTLRHGSEVVTTLVRELR